MKRVKKDGWYLSRGYSHFDHPLSFDAAAKIVKNPRRVASHSFLPLVSFTDVKRQFRTDNSDKTIPRKQRRKIVKSKRREIKYASHVDSAIFSYYAYLLQERYEPLIRLEGLNKSIIGYRSGLGSNIDLAADAFAEIAHRGDVVALCFDIENFFPSILHSSLKAALCEILGVPVLSADWYAVFKNVCSYADVELKDLALQEGFDPKDPPFPLVSDISSALLRSRSSKIIKKNSTNKAVPQGTPISAVFANVSMLPLDRAMHRWCLGISGSYRRYSDDIMLLVPPGFELEAEQKLISEACALSLIVNAAKTEVSRFYLANGIQKCDIPVQYLGFIFDGDRVRLRDRALSRYYRRMTYATRQSVRGAGIAGKLASQAHKRSLFRDFTHLGTRNFYTYAKRAHKKFPKSAIKRQMRRHFQVLLRKLSNRGR
ncbi:antiviral reverse transcriptase Drt2 [Sphingomonas ursincola]|uniref:antiviral reverse transcriptase Drt2 n=1 Tax=Sphingomonas ursincola TaxID=56361 RepID=UPI0023542538|nr:antiviral reverse transcriptase Drt2 [Sphingomonas ursincola]MBY0619390.1 hypothetical protein [Sphingomonas ursincola]